MSGAPFNGMNYIDGAWRTGVAAFETRSPSDLDDVVGTYAKAGAADVEEAMAAARRALPAWRSFNMQARADILRKAGDLLMARMTEIGTLLSREEGKTLPEAIGEVGRAAAIFKFFAGEALRPSGEMIPSVRPDVGIEITREPLGAIGIITPWNFPIAIPAW